MKSLVVLLGMLFALHASAFELKDKNGTRTFERVAHINDFITLFSEIHFTEEIFQAEGLPGDQLVIIDSPGGQMEMGQHMIDRLEELKAKGHKIVCLVDGWAASMAFNILTHCDERYATTKSKFLFHPISGYDSIKFGRPTPRNLRKMAKELEEDDAPYKAANSAALHLGSKAYDYYGNKNQQWSAEQLYRRHYLNGVLRIKKHASTAK